jgi:hypothetical protein
MSTSQRGCMRCFQPVVYSSLFKSVFEYPPRRSSHLKQVTLLGQMQRGKELRRRRLFVLIIAPTTMHAFLVWTAE